MQTNKGYNIHYESARKKINRCKNNRQDSLEETNLTLRPKAREKGRHQKKGVRNRRIFQAEAHVKEQKGKEFAPPRKCQMVGVTNAW